MRTVEETNQMIDAGLGKIPCDLVIKNVKLVNVYSQEIYETKIYIKGKRIVSIDPEATLEAEQEVDGKGMYALPGFIDGHMHYSSSMISPEAMAQVIIPQGTTTLGVDLMEIANVFGKPIVDLLLEGQDDLPYRIATEVPTRVPTAPGLETTGEIINVEESRELLSKEGVISLGEIAPAKILQRTDDNVQKIVDAINMGKIVNGHAVGVTTQEISVYAGAGITDDHEPVEWEEALDRLRVGIEVMIREGSGARNLRTFVEKALELGYGFENTFFCTDDKHITDIQKEGHINHNVNLAIELGVEPITAITMATLNAAKHFRVEHDFGSVTPGRFADIILCKSINEVHPEVVYYEGEKVFEKDKQPVEKIDRQYPDWAKTSVKLKNEITADSFKLEAPEGNDSVKINLIELVKDQIINKHKTATLPVEKGEVMRDPDNDIMKFSVVERYGKNGNVGIYFVKGFELKKGALAYSMSHNHQNICVIGENDEDMALAVNEIAKMNGGLVTVIDGEVIESMALTIGGLISEETDARVIADQLTAMNESAVKTGTNLAAPFMTLSFIGHPAIAELGPTDMGLVDVLKQEFIPVIIEE